MSLYADVVLPLAQPPYTYQIPEGVELGVGDAVLVPLGAQRDKFYTGIVWRVHSEQPNFKRIKSIVRKLSSAPLLCSGAIKFWEWVSTYYIASLGEVMRVALPSTMKPSGWDSDELSRFEFRPREEYYVALTPEYRDESVLSNLLDSLKTRAVRQYNALCGIASVADDQKINRLEVPRRLLACDMNILSALARKGVLTLSKHPTTIETLSDGCFSLPQLTEHQSLALNDIESSFESRSTTLLHGVTGSGKTEVYIHLIAQTLARGADALLLVPEIALTTQLIERMERIFGSRVIAYHSKLSNSKRTEVYLQLNSSQGGSFVVGVRSSIFLPLKKLGLIIVDEEHDPSYKQSDPAPRYNARDCAAALASMVGAKTLLGSATPSLESWLNSKSGKYGFAKLDRRYGDAVPPRITISDTIRSSKRGERRGHFNFSLLDRIEERVACGEQVILFQNRRGFSPYIECGECGWSARCPNCNVTLTLHKGQNRLSCHYCGHTEPLMALCPSCKVAEPRPMGFGTEKIEEQLAAMMPDVGVVRLDRDTVTSERALRTIINTFEGGSAQIMVGTQMVTKGFDFSRVTLVGILNADNMLHSPDFRAEERAYQLMTQVAGRSGRRSTEGEVVIQTSQPDHRILDFVRQSDYESMAATLLEERAAFLYPPYARLTVITLRHTNLDLLRRATNQLASRLRAIFGRRLQGPASPPIDRIRGEYIINMMLKIELGSSAAKARGLLQREIALIKEDMQFKPVVIVCDVDPQ